MVLESGSRSATRNIWTAFWRARVSRALGGETPPLRLSAPSPPPRPLSPPWTSRVPARPRKAGDEAQPGTSTAVRSLIDRAEGGRRRRALSGGAPTMPVILVTATLVLASVTIVSPLAGVHDARGDVRLSRERFVALRGLYYPGFTLEGLAEPLAILALSVLLASVARSTPAFWLVALALAAEAGAHLLYWVLIVPINRDWLAGERAPGAGRAPGALGAVPRLPPGRLDGGGRPPGGGDPRGRAGRPVTAAAPGLPRRRVQSIGSTVKIVGRRLASQRRPSPPSALSGTFRVSRCWIDEMDRPSGRFNRSTMGLRSWYVPSI